MIKNAPILILDEATAFAEPDNEAKVQAAFSRLSQGKTVIMIAHRLSSVIDADRDLCTQRRRNLPRVVRIRNLKKQTDSMHICGKSTINRFVGR